MNFIKILFFLFTPIVVLATDDFDENYQTRNTAHLTKQLQRQYWVASLESIEPQYNSSTDHPNKLKELIAGFNHRLSNQFPSLPGFNVYYQSDEGKIWIATFCSMSSDNDKLILKLFDAEQSRSNLIMRGSEFNFSFAYTQKNRTEKRNHPHLIFSIPDSLQLFRNSSEPEKLQEGHGGDQADSRDSMGCDRINFMGQYEYYNESIRNHLVRHQIRKFLGAYAEYAIAAHNPPLTEGGTFIPEAYLFLKYVNNTLECFLFPNYPSNYYDKIETSLPKIKSAYLEYMDIFKIDLDTHFLLSPFIYSSQVTDIEIEEKVEKNFQTADLIASGHLHLIPQQKQDFYPPQVIQSFHYRVALWLYEQGASIEMFSIRHKISLVEKFIDEVSLRESEINFFQPNAARFWLNVSESQVINTVSSLKDKVELFRFHTSFHQLIDSEEILQLQNKSKADKIYEQISHQVQNELYFDEDQIKFKEFVNEIRINVVADLKAKYLLSLSNMLSHIFSSYGLDDPDSYGFNSSDEIEEFGFAEEWLEMDAEDREWISIICEAKKIF